MTDGVDMGSSFNSAGSRSNISVPTWEAAPVNIPAGNMIPAPMAPSRAEIPKKASSFDSTELLLSTPEPEEVILAMRAFYRIRPDQICPNAFGASYGYGMRDIQKW